MEEHQNKPSTLEIWRDAPWYHWWREEVFPTQLGLHFQVAHRLRETTTALAKHVATELVATTPSRDSETKRDPQSAPSYQRRT